MEIDRNVYELPAMKIAKVGKLQRALLAKAKSDSNYRFYSLWDKVCREDILQEAWKRCRRKAGASGVDGVTFAEIESSGVEQWLLSLRVQLQNGTYRPEALRRVWIPKTGGGQRALGIPTIRDRVAQMAVVLVITPIFEADLCDEQMGFRVGRDAKMAVRQAFWQVCQKGREDVVDADLSDYFNTIPHGALLKSVARRIADGRLLAVIRSWLKAPVLDESQRGRANKQTARARRENRGTPQGGVISPLLANIYFRRFILGWKKLGWEERTDSVLVNYADDLVICCHRGKGAEALGAMTQLMGKLGLTVNTEKTRLLSVPEERFDFLGYTVGRFYGKDGKPYMGTRPSVKSVSRMMGVIHDETTSQWYPSDPEIRVAVLNKKLRGWVGYFDQGPVVREYQKIQNHLDRRLRRWLMRRRGKRGTGYRQYSDEYLYEELGLMKLPRTIGDQMKAKARKPGMRAGCGKSASPVRRAGAGNGMEDPSDGEVRLQGGKSHSKQQGTDEPGL